MSTNQVFHRTWAITVENNRFLILGWNNAQACLDCATLDEAKAAIDSFGVQS